MSFIPLGFGLGIAAGPFFAVLLAGMNFDLPFVFFEVMLVVSAWVVRCSVPETVGKKAKRFKHSANFFLLLTSSPVWIY